MFTDERMTLDQAAVVRELSMALRSLSDAHRYQKNDAMAQMLEKRAKQVSRRLNAVLEGEPDDDA